jgi:beta-1,4-mannosyltransferase
MVVQTPNLAERMTRDFDVAEERIEVVENGVDLDRFAGSRPMDTTGSEAPLILVYAGALDGNHDIRPLVRAALQRPGRIEVRILGSGPLRPELEGMIAKAETGRIRLFGRVEPRDVVKHLGEADLCVAAYSPETQGETGFQFSPLKLMEYAAAGRPAVVAGPAPPEAGVVAPNVNGFFIPNETEAWIHLFDRLPGRDVLSRMGWKGRERVLGMGWDRAAEKIVRLTLNRSTHPAVAAMPYSNTENRYIGLLHDHLSAAKIRLLDPGNLRLRWLEAHAGCVDLIHLHWPESHYQFPNPAYSFLKWLYLMRRLKAAERLGYRIVWTVHNLEAHDRRYGVLDRMVRRHLLQQAGIILLGEGALPALERRFGASPTQPSTVIRHGHYIGCYGEILDPAHCRKALGLPLDKKVYLFFGTMRYYKGVDELVRIFARIRLRDAVLAAAGNVPDREIEKRIQSHAETDPDRIRFFPGFIPDARAGLFLQAADFLVLPYREIHMSGTLLASLSYARPVIAPDLGLIRDYLPEGAGILYDPADPEGLERALRQSEEVDALEMGRQGLAFAQSLDWAEIAKEHRRFYARLARKDRGRP